MLLQRAADDGKWYTVGGAVDPGEEAADAVVREVLEETGLNVVPERMIGVYTDPLAVYRNGDEVLYVSTCFACRVVAGCFERRWAVMTNRLNYAIFLSMACLNFCRRTGIELRRR